MNKYEIAVAGEKIANSKGIGRGVAKLISSLCALKGQVMNDEDIVIIANALRTDLKERYGGLTMEEVDIALNNGVRGDYGDYYGLNLITFLGWIKAYSMSNARLDAKKSCGVVKSLPPVSPVYEFEKMKMLCLRSFNLYTETKNVGYMYVTIYQFLQKIGLISQTIEFKLSVIDQLKAKKLLEKRNKYAMARVIEIDDAMIKLDAQAICLAAYYDGLIEMGIGLGDAFTNYK